MYRKKMECRKDENKKFYLTCTVYVFKFMYVCKYNILFSVDINITIERTQRIFSVE